MNLKYWLWSGVIVIVIMVCIASFGNLITNDEAVYQKATNLLESDSLKALELYIQFIKKYPHSEYAELACEKSIKILNNMQRHSDIINLYHIARKGDVKISEYNLYLIAGSSYVLKEYQLTFDLLKSIDFKYLYNATNEKDKEIIRNHYYLLLLSQIHLDTNEQNALLQEYFSLFPEDNDILYVVGGEYIKIGRNEEGIKLIQQYLDIVSEKEEVSLEEMAKYVSIQSFYMISQKYDVAYFNLKKVREQALKYPKLHEAFHFQFGVSAFYQKEYVMAKKSLEYILANSHKQEMLKISENYLKKIKQGNQE